MNNCAIVNPSETESIKQLPNKINNAANFLFQRYAKLIKNYQLINLKF